MWFYCTKDHSDTAPSSPLHSNAMRTVYAIGIGTGNPAHLTGEAAEAIAALDAVLILDKGEDTADMRQLRTELIATHAPHNPRIITIADTSRDPDLARRDYRRAVAQWHERRAAAITEVLVNDLDDDVTTGFLVWGDPALYDSTLRILADVQASGVALEVKVIAGLSAPSVLCAAFGILANAVGQPIHLTTGRQLPHTDPHLLANCFVMLDGDLSYRGLVPPETEIYWGAYLGDPQRQILIHGSVADVTEQIVDARSTARGANGWIMDTYLLRAPQR